jgi:hypothetical protein
VSPISIPVILPDSNASPPPTPNPTVTPTPNPSPTPQPDDPGPTTSACSLPPSSPKNPVCVDDSPQFDTEVDDAIDRVVKNRPDLFDLNNKKCSNCYFVKDIDTYAALVVEEVGKVGLCALWDGEEIAVKQTNNRNEQYDIILASGHIRRPPGAYRGSCSPSLF